RSTSTSVRGSSSSTRSAKHSTQTRHSSSSGKSSNSQTPKRRSTRPSPTASASGHPRTPCCANSTASPRSTPPRRTSSTANATTAGESWNGSLATSTAPDGYATAQPPGRSTFSSCSPATRPSANSARPASPTGNSPQRSNRPHMICSSAAEARGSGASCSRRTAALSDSVSRRRTDERRSARDQQSRRNEERDRAANQHSAFVTLTAAALPLVLLTQRAHCAGPDYRAARLKHTARRNGQEFHRGDQSQSRASPNHQRQTRQETSLTVFRTDNKSWSSCGAERT